MDVMALRRGLLAQMATVSDDKHLECGSFTLTEATKHYTIHHSLGAVPDFCILYPIDIANTSETYAIGFQVLVGNIGQANWNISSKNEMHGAWRMMYVGTNYAINAPTPSTSYNAPSNAGYAGTATDTTLEVGGTGTTGSAGKMIPGTYGYIIGRLNN